MNESVRNAVEQQLEHARQTGESIHTHIKDLEKQLESLYSERESIIKAKHELENFLYSPRSEKNE